ncbi:MAG: tRNA threonylcarbamoyladenosine dehydratase [Lachnospiraceae bacterium]|nr:tRNA threonylcarbamoyladenosine dehydratase [Lachnospiraceae bacterium]
MSMKTDSKVFDDLAGWDERTVKLIGKEANEKIKNAHIAVFGIGGVGGFAVEALARAGVSKLTVVDGDIVTKTNLNRQIIATACSLNRPKVDVIKERILSINKEAVVYPHHLFLLPGEMMERFDFAGFDYVIDAVDNVTLKIELAVKAASFNTPIISSMGTGSKLDPSRLEVADIYQTSICPLAKVMRRELRKRGLKELKVVYSKEEPIKPVNVNEEEARIPGSISFVPSAAGLLLAATVVRDIIGIPPNA